MKKDKKSEKLQDTLSSIDSVLAALDSYPSLEDALLAKAQGQANKYLGQLFPTQLDFGKEILEHLVGTDVLIKIVSEFLTYALPGVEIGLKSALLANMQNLGTNCTIDPIIYEKAIKEGVVFDLKQIDLIDKLTISPLDRKIGKYYYFGIEGCESAYDVLQSAIDPNNQTESRKKNWSKNRKDGQTQKEGTSYLNRAMNDSVGHYFGGRKRDFDCLLWYMKNKAAYREVWGKRTSEKEDIFNGDTNIQGWINKRGNKKTCYYNIDGTSLSFYTKEGSNATKPNSGSLVKMDEGTTYVFLKGTTYYEYKFGLPPIQKLSRSKYYLNRDGDTYHLYYWDDTKWSQKQIASKPKYSSISELPVTTKKNDCVCIDNSFYVITSDPKVKEKTKKNELGIETKQQYISAKIEECIDITNALKNNTDIFVDYDLGTNKQDIKDGKDVTSTFIEFCPTNTGQKQWYSEKSKNTSETITSENCYYAKKSDGDFDINVDKILIEPHVIKTENNKTKAKYCVNVTNAMAKKNKYTKDFGVLTLEFSPRTGNVLQSDGKPMQQQTPYDNVLHVFYGNVKEINTTERDVIQSQWKESSDANKIGVQVYDKMINIQEKHTKLWKKKLKQWKKIGNPNGEQTNVIDKNIVYRESDEFRIASQDYYTLTFGNGTQLLPNLTTSSNVYDSIDGITKKLTNINNIIDEFYSSKIEKDKENKDQENDDEFNYGKFQDFEKKLIECLTEEQDGNKTGFAIYAYCQRAAQLMDANENLLYLSAKDLQYPEAKKNYYLKRTLFEFNTDYINSLQLFDPKVLAAQLITSLFGGLTMELIIGATASWKTELIRDVVKDMVEKTIAAEDIAVSDCFFTFTNDAYNGMLRAAELRQAGLYSTHGEENGNNVVDPVKLLEGLNGIDDAADQAGQTEIIKGAITTAAGEVSKDIYKENSGSELNKRFDWNKSFIETLITNLCTQLVMAMLSPKVYLLILINLEMFGLSTNFDLKSFIERFENLIRSLVKSVVDQFMQYLVQKIMEIVEDLVQKLIDKLAFEQAEMYMRLLKQIWMHLKMLARCDNGLEWEQDYVTSADIISSDSQEPVNEC